MSQRNNEAPPRSEEECEIWQEDTIKSQKSSGLALQSHFQNDSVKVGSRTIESTAKGRLLQNISYSGVETNKTLKIVSYNKMTYPGIVFGGGVQQIQLRTEETGIWGR